MSDDPYSAISLLPPSPDRDRLLGLIQAQNEAVGRGYYYGGGTVPAGATAMVTPMATDEQGKTSVQMPGIAYDLYSRFGRFIPQVLTGLGHFGADPWDEQPAVVPPAPGVEAAEEHVKGAERWSLANVPHPQPQTDQDLAAMGVGLRVGEMVSPIIPGKLLTNLPAAVGGAARWIIPTAKDVPLVAGGGLALMAGAGLTDQAQAASPDVTDQAVSKGQPDQTGITDTIPPPAAQPAAPAVSPPSVQPQDSGVSAGRTALEIAGIGGLLWSTLKFGPRGFDYMSDVLRGVPRDAGDVIRDLDMGAPNMSVAGGTTPNVPLPGGAGGASKQAAAYWYNQSAVRDALEQAIAPSKEIADARIAQSHQINQEGTATTLMEHQFRTGVSNATGNVGPVMVDGKRMIDQMSDGQRQMANQAAWAQNELNNRADPARGGNMITYGGTPLTMTGYDDLALQHFVAQGMADPQIKQWLDWKDTVPAFIRDDALQTQMITQTQYDAAKQLYPNWMPTVDVSGNVYHSWNPRPSDAVGWAEPPIPAWDAMSMYYDKAYRAMAKDADNRDLIYRLSNNPDPNISGIVKKLPGPSDLQQPIEVPTAKGIEYWDVRNRPLKTTMQNNSTQVGQFLSGVNAIRRTFQSGVVGPLSMLGEQLFAVKHALRYAIGGAAQLPTSAYSGYLDRALRQTIGMGMPARWDPTAVPGIMMTGGRDIGAAFAKNIADALSTSSNPMTALYRTLLGQRGVDATRAWLEARYASSNAAARAGAGLQGGGSLGVRDVSPRLYGQAGAYARDPVYNVSPMQSKPGLMANTNVPLGPVGRSIVSSYINLRSLIRDIHGAIIESPNSFFYDINRDNPAYMEHGQTNLTRLAGDMRGILGDPAQHGAGTGARIFGTVPLANIGMQATAAILRRFRDNPIMWTAASLSPLIAASLGSHLSAIVSGKEHQDYLENHISSGQRGSNVYIFHGPGTTPDDHTEISLPQGYRWLYPIVDDLVSSGIGAWRAFDNEDTWQRMVSTISEMFSHHVTTHTMDATKLGAIDASTGFFSDIPPVVSGVIGALGGRDPGKLTTAMGERALEDRPLTTNLLSPPNQDRIPGQEASMVRSDADSLKAFLHSLTGVMGDSLWQIAHNYHIRDQAMPGDGGAWADKGFWQDLKQNVAEQNRWGNVIWGAHMPMTSRGAIDDRVDRAISNIRATANALNDLRLQGLTRNKGVEIPVVGDNPVPADPVMRNMYTNMSRFNQLMNQHFMPGISDIYKQLQVLKESPMMADEKRRIGNELEMQLTTKHQQLWGEIEKLNDALSKQAGGRVDVSKPIDWTKGVEQFHN